MKEGEAFVTLGQVNFVAVKTEHGVIATDFPNVKSLGNFEFPRSLHAFQGGSIEVGMSGSQSLEQL